MTREEIIEAIQNDNMMPFLQDWEARDVVDFVLKNIQPSLPDGLEEAADKQAFIESPYSWESQPGTFGSTPLFLMSNIRSAFKAGAEWAFRQGWTFDAHKGAFGICFDGNIDNLLDSLKDKEEVTVQIRKK